MNSRKLSLRHAKQYRTCPPPGVANDPSRSEAVDRHLAGCPYCSSEEYESLAFWQEVIRKFHIPSSATESLSDPGDLAPGQIRLIKPEYAVWQKGLYYNPPWVLILDIADDGPGGVQVAQIYHDITLAGPGDLILEEGQTGLTDLFVECWNTYTLKSDFLGPAVAGVSAEIVAAVKQMDENEDALPQWAMLPLPLTEHDPRAYFRELEVEVGYLFASRAVSDMMAEIETPELNYATAVELQEDIRRKADIIQFPRQLDNLEAALTSARFLPEDYRKAAAAIGDRESIAANMVGLWDGRIKSFKPTRGIVFDRYRDENSFRIRGAFPAVPDTAVNPRLICIYWSKATGSMTPDDMQWEVLDRSFTATFQTAQQDGEVVEFALVYETDEED